MGTKSEMKLPVFIKEFIDNAPIENWCDDGGTVPEMLAEMKENGGPEIPSEGILNVGYVLDVTPKWVEEYGYSHCIILEYATHYILLGESESDGPISHYLCEVRKF